MTSTDFEALHAEGQRTGEIPTWQNLEAFTTLSRGYLLPEESPRGMYQRLAKTATKTLGRGKTFETDLFNAFWNNWICPASPVCSNYGTTRGMPISCFSSTIPDSVDGIFKTVHETAMLSKHGGGIGHYWGEVRGRGVDITGNGQSEGIIPWLKIEDTVIASVSQGGVRRGSSAQYLDVSHPDIEEFIDVRRQTGDDSRRCRSVGFHHAVVFDDGFMQRVEDGDEEARRIWSKFLKTRWEMGEPYAMFGDNANKAAPDIYKDKNLRITTSNLCSEIMLFTDDDHTFVCCLSSMNLARYDEWKGTNAVQLAIWFLDAVMEDFIQQARDVEGFERSVRFAEASRALGLGALGWHTLLQSKMLPFESFPAMQLNNEIWRHIREEATIATTELADAYGEPDWCKGYGVRNTHLLAVAPTLSNSIISGGVSEGVQPIVANVYANKTAKGTFLRRNPALEILLESKGHNDDVTWRKINADRGSVKHLDFLTDEEKAVFLTAREINQFALVRQAAQRQKYIDQGQSLNLFFSTPPEDASDETRNLVARYVHDVHMEAWKTGLKSLYYMRTESPLKGDAVFKQESDCLACEA